jgi:hypothetical protein
MEGDVQLLDIPRLPVSPGCKSNERPQPAPSGRMWR